LSSVATPEAGTSIVRLLAGDAPVEIKRLALAALRQNLEGPWSSLRKDETLKTGVAAALEIPELTTDALAVIGTAGLGEFAPPIVRVLDNGQTPEATRLAAIGVAGRLALAETATALAKQLQSQQPAIREAAVAALVATREPRT